MPLLTYKNVEFKRFVTNCLLRHRDAKIAARAGGEIMSRSYHLAVFAGLLIVAGGPLLRAQQRGNGAPAAAANADRPPTPIPPEKSSVTSHEMTLNGKPLRYTATAGNLLIQGDDGQSNASVFYVAYTLEGVTDLGTRPLTFLYNGGPGSASMWLHMGSVGRYACSRRALRR